MGSWVASELALIVSPRQHGPLAIKDDRPHGHVAVAPGGTGLVERQPHGLVVGHWRRLFTPVARHRSHLTGGRRIDMPQLVVTAVIVGP
jgi:hypothetical protein